VHRATKKTVKWYGVWAFALVTVAALGNSFGGHGEYGISTHLWLTITGLPLSLLSWYLPNGTVLGVLSAGLIGTVQWAVVAEANSRWEAWYQAHHPAETTLLSPRTKLRLLWTMALLSPLAAGYGLLSVYLYAWLNAAGSWSAERASLWSSVAFAFFCFFVVVSVVTIRLLLRHYNSLPPLPDQDEVKSP
jgi:hypothetical protein